jgi:hypothetical protein
MMRRSPRNQVSGDERMFVLSNTFLKLLDLVEGGKSPESEDAHYRLAYGGFSARYETWCIAMNPLEISDSWYDLAKSKKRNAFRSLSESAHLFREYPSLQRKYEEARDRFDREGR